MSDDANENGVHDSGETGIAGVTVSLYDLFGNQIGSSVTTKSSGIYSLTAPPDDDYMVVVSGPSGESFTTPSTISLSTAGRKLREQ